MVVPLNSQFVKKILSGDMYEKLVKRSFKAWRKKMFPCASSARLSLVKRYERFLRQDRNLKAEVVAGLKTLREHPKVSPDLNAMENVLGFVARSPLTDSSNRHRVARRFYQAAPAHSILNEQERQGAYAWLLQESDKCVAPVEKLRGARC